MRETDYPKNLKDSFADFRAYALKKYAADKAKKEARPPDYETINQDELESRWDDILKTFIPYISTAWGFQEITGLRSDRWVVCGKENAGFGISYCCHSGTTIYLKRR